jgi:hypothetical protein
VHGVLYPDGRVIAVAGGHFGSLDEWIAYERGEAEELKRRKDKRDATG